MCIEFMGEVKSAGSTGAHGRLLVQCKCLAINLFVNWVGIYR